MVQVFARKCKGGELRARRFCTFFVRKRPVGGTMFTRLLRALKPPTPEERAASQARVAAAAKAIRAAAQPALSLVPTRGARSRLGGKPSLPPGAPWPRNQGRPLAFLARIDLAEARAAGGPEWLPAQGHLLFFYDVEANAGGSHNDERPCWSVIRASPESAAAAARVPEDLPEESRFRGYPVRFAMRKTLPPWERWNDIGGPLDKREARSLDDALDGGDDPDPDHQIGGYPNTLQGDDMELTCELVARGIPLGRKPYDDPDVVVLKPAAQQRWRLLLQLDSDERMGTDWTDGGRLYFWIPEEDARAGDFSRVWLRSQFY
jgi:hypothetical protein